MGFVFPVESVRAFTGSRAASHSGIQPVFDIGSTHALDSCHADIEGITDGFVRPTWFTYCLIGFEQNTRMGQSLG